MIELSHTVRPSKKKAYEIILDCKISVDNNLTDDNIDKLINFFAPPLQKTAKTVEQWVAKAVADKNEVRHYLQFLYVEDGVIYATDGARIHWGKTAWLNGYYDPKTMLPVKCDNKFPQVERAIKQGFNDSKGVINLAEIKKGVVSDKINVVKIDDEFYINEKYFNDAINGCNDIDTIAYKANNGYLMCESNPFGNFIIGRIRT